MVDSKTLNISIRAIIKDLKVLRSVPNDLKTKNMCKHEVKSYRWQQSMFLTNIRLKECAIKIF